MQGLLPLYQLFLARMQSPVRTVLQGGREVVGQKRPLLAKQVWAIRARLELSGNLRDLALFNLAIDSKLRGCDLVRLNASLRLLSISR